MAFHDESMRVRDVMLAEPAQFFRRKFGKNTGITIIFSPHFNYDALDVG